MLFDDMPVMEQIPPAEEAPVAAKTIDSSSETVVEREPFFDEEVKVCVEKFILLLVFTRRWEKEIQKMDIELIDLKKHPVWIDGVKDMFNRQKEAQAAWSRLNESQKKEAKEKFDGIIQFCRDNPNY